jgi:hypothetical protein
MHIPLYTQHEDGFSALIPSPIVVRLQRAPHRRRNARTRQNRVYIDAPRVVDAYNVQLLQLTLRARPLQRIAKRRRRRRLSSLLVVIVQRKPRPFATENWHAHRPAWRRKKVHLSFHASSWKAAVRMANGRAAVRHAHAMPFSQGPSNPAIYLCPTRSGVVGLPCLKRRRWMCSCDGFPRCDESAARGRVEWEYSAGD